MAIEIMPGRRLLQWIRYRFKQHRRDGAVILGSLLLAWLFLYAASGSADERESGFFYALAGAAIASAGAAVVRAIYRAEAYQQGAYTERASVIQTLLAAAREDKDILVVVWQRDYDISRHSTLKQLGFHHRPWIGSSGVESVRRYVTATEQIGHRIFQSREEAEAAVDGPFETLYDELMQLLGVWHD